MSQGSCQIVWLTGVPGSGKTMLTARILARRDPLQNYACILNDDGTSGAVDGEALTRLAAVTAVGNGCFTCSDPSQLAGTIARHAENFTRIIVEGFGFVNGEEIRRFLQLLPAAIQRKVVCMFDAAHFKPNLAHYSGILEDQLQKSDLVMITKTPDFVKELEHPWMQNIIDFIITNAPGVPVAMVPLCGLTDEIIDLVFEPVHSHKQTSDHRDHDHHHYEYVYDEHCDHDHAEHDHHGYGAFRSYGFALRHEVTVQDVAAILAGSSSLGITSVKGACGGPKQFRILHDGEPTYGELDDDRHFLTVYARPLPQWFLDHIRHTLAVTPDAQSHLTTKEILRAGGVPEEQTKAAIEYFMSQGTEEPIINGLGKLITHPTWLQMPKEMARRPEAKERLFGPVIRWCMQYWVKAGRLLLEKADEWDPEDVANNMRELSASLGWWIYYNREDIGKELVGQALALDPARMASLGYSKLAIAFRDAEQGWWQAEEFRVTALLGKHYGTNMALCVSAARHCANLYRKQQAPEYAANRWQQIHEELLKF